MIPVGMLEHIGVSAMGMQKIAQGNQQLNVNPRLVEIHNDPDSTSMDLLGEFLSGPKPQLVKKPTVKPPQTGYYDHETFNRWHLENNETPSKGHGFSRIPNGKDEGLILKLDGHPTRFKTLIEDQKLGAQFYRRGAGKDPSGRVGRLYSFLPGDLDRLYPDSQSQFVPVSEGELRREMFEPFQVGGAEQRMHRFGHTLDTHQIFDVALATYEMFPMFDQEPQAVRHMLMHGVGTGFFKKNHKTVKYLNQAHAALDQGDMLTAHNFYKMAEAEILNRTDITPTNRGEYAAFKQDISKRVAETENQEKKPIIHSGYPYNKTLPAKKEAVKAKDSGDERYLVHTVEAGDTLYGLSKKYGIEVNDIVSINNIKNKDLISVGADIKIPKAVQGNLAVNAADYLTRMEGVRLEPYKLPNEGSFTVGYGHYLRGKRSRAVFKELDMLHLYPQLVRGKGKLTEEQARRLFVRDLQDYIKLARRLTPNFDTLSPELQVQIISATYRGSWGQSPKTRKLVSQGKFSEAGDEFLDNDEYRNAKALGRPGIRPRMEKVSEVLKEEAKPG